MPNNSKTHGKRISPHSSANGAHSPDEGYDLAQWLQEVARRRTPSQREAATVHQPADASCGIPGSKREFALVRKTVLLCCLTLAYLQYYFIGVMSEMYSIRSIVIFAAPAADATERT